MGIAAVMMGGMGTIMAGSLAMQGHQMAQGSPKMPNITFPDTKPDAVNENEAQKEREKRRRSYAGMGRSSTILTQNLGTLGQDDTRPKTLLGL